MRFLIVLSGPSIRFDGAEGKPVVEEALLARLEKTLEIWTRLIAECDDLFVITSGGDRDGARPLAASTVMKSWLVERGIPIFRIYEDIKARNTKENAANCCALMVGCCREGGLMMIREVGYLDAGYVSPYQRMGPISEIHVVTSEFHLRRTKILFEASIEEDTELKAATRHYHGADNGLQGDKLVAYLKAEEKALEALDERR